VSASTADGAIASTFLSSQPINITLEFDLDRVDSAFTAGFDLVGYDSTVVFRTAFTDIEEGPRPKVVEGRNVLTCTIPPGLLNNGRYSISLRFSLHFIRWIAQEDQVLQFDVIADHGDSLFLNGQVRPGMISPILDWSVGTPPAVTANSAAAVPSR
jgi:hypothetical protein